MKTIVLTGASGGVAGMIRPLLRTNYKLRLSDRGAAPADLGPNEEWHQADLTDAGAMAALVDGADGVIHLGGQSVEADWETVARPNIDGLYNILTACHEKGVNRFIFASSNHAMGFYPRRRRVGIDQAVRPDGLYGVSKAFGEAICSLFADKHGMRCMSIRIGNVGTAPLDIRRLSIWLHPEDLVQLIEIGLEHPEIHHAIVYGASHNERTWWDNTSAHSLGYEPKHNAEDHRDHALAEQAKIPAEPVGDLFQGGTFTGDGFDGDLDRTLNARPIR
ncbi:NAD(P)-dependent oxidoreductase [Acuticoccus sp. MNP-M23]|uniref:NAD-dependent epimerase/dehydratase family protein n=1 Tax=Acuticoccus sp. MNP-M23 TaxID=3072793 RepID=UPI0028155290|nr:NAD(P)-dependent oxidoreductase [Acuticoccus sp. MNP-M23]WMS42589.1 NAD(P)-dependent oxidoreductase [Acuticoccus sp. MNP-M23]